MTLKEEFRPKTLKEFIGHEDVKKSIQIHLTSDSRQDIIFFGPPGTGKTTMARIIAYFYYRDNYEAAIMDLNASDDNGVDVIRNKVAKKARARPLEPGKPQIIFLDEADALTPQAQMALRRTMEDNDENALFILATNNLNAIIEPLQSRCKANIYLLDRLKDSEIESLIVDLAKRTQATIDNNIVTIVKQSNGDARAAVDFFESWSKGSLRGENVDNIQQLLMRLRDPYTSEIYPLLEWVELKDLTNLSMRILEDPAYTLEKKTILNRIISAADFRIQRSHNADIHLIDMMYKLREELAK